MIPAPFEYVKPSTVEEAIAALSEAGDDGKVLAGGQSLLPVLRLRLASPSVLVDLGGVPQLRGIRVDGDELVIGAMTTYAEVASSPVVAEHVPLLAETAAQVGDRQVRHLGTVGGSLAHADPAGDMPAVAAALDARFVIAGPSGERTVGAADFAVDFFTTALAPNEVLVAVRFPSYAGWGMRYEKLHRTAQAWAIVGVAAAVQRQNGSIAQARVALTNMGPKAVRASAVEQALAGADASADAVKAASAQAAEGTSPPDDLSGSAEYRRHLATVLTARALSSAAGL
jgi:carbon-monoxide dehydrogenase medium subunit